MELLPISMVSMLPAWLIQANEVTSLNTELGREVRAWAAPRHCRSKDRWPFQHHLHWVA